MWAALIDTSPGLVIVLLARGFGFMDTTKPRAARWGIAGEDVQTPSKDAVSQRD
jgi:hypothetical protein